MLYERVEIVIEKSERVRENDVYYIRWIDIDSKNEAIVAFHFLFLPTTDSICLPRVRL